jgi:hypothetical protein
VAQLLNEAKAGTGSMKRQKKSKGLNVHIILLCILSIYQLSMIHLIFKLNPALNQREDGLLGTNADNHPYMINGNIHLLEKQREYTYDDFETVFNVVAIHEQILTDKVYELLKNHDAKTDDYYLENKEMIDERYHEFVHYITAGSHEQEDRERFAIKWVSNELGFGMFAKKPIFKGEIVGNYVGLVTGFKENTDYMWGYMTEKVGDGIYEMGIDSRIAGNYLRFVNHAGVRANSLVQFFDVASVYSI